MINGRALCPMCGKRIGPVAFLLAKRRWGLALSSLAKGRPRVELLCPGCRKPIRPVPLGLGLSLGAIACYAAAVFAALSLGGERVTEPAGLLVFGAIALGGLWSLLWLLFANFGALEDAAL